MPIPTIPKALYPAVPKALGIPPMLRNAAKIADTLTLGYLGISDKLDSILGGPEMKWAIFDSSGKSIATYDSMRAHEYHNEARISDHPVEQGQFASYNKTDNPFDIIVTLTCGGSEERRTAFLAALEDARKSLKIYTVATPEVSYKNVNFVGISMRRSDREGATLLTVELVGREVRSTKITKYSSSKSPAGSVTLEQGMIKTVRDVNIDVSRIA